jgi:hypothetical protein
MSEEATKEEEKQTISMEDYNSVKTESITRKNKLREQNEVIEKMRAELEEMKNKGEKTAEEEIEKLKKQVEENNSYKTKFNEMMELQYEEAIKGLSPEQMKIVDDEELALSKRIELAKQLRSTTNQAGATDNPNGSKKPEDLKIEFIRKIKSENDANKKLDLIREANSQGVEFNSSELK